MEKYTVSRELAEKLKKAGFPQTTQYTYYIFHSEVKFLDKISVNQHFSDRAVSDDDLFAAPISDELLEQLPKLINRNQFLSLTYPINLWVACYTVTVAGRDGTKLKDMPTGDTAVEALAQLYLWCAEHGYLEGQGS